MEEVLIWLSYFTGLTRRAASLPGYPCSLYALRKVIIMCPSRKPRVCDMDLISPSTLCLPSAYRCGASYLLQRLRHRLCNSGNATL
ncbi:hypothetical protein EDD15DRAFT_2307736, partial [Pisolithus albus]